jgi:hypothetical protein
MSEAPDLDTGADVEPPHKFDERQPLVKSEAS